MGSVLTLKEFKKENLENSSDNIEPGNDIHAEDFEQLHDETEEQKIGSNFYSSQIQSTVQPRLLNQNVTELTGFTERENSYLHISGLQNNPWDVCNASEFLKYCCPECDFKSGELDGFSQHAIGNHVLSNILFNFSEFKDFE